MRYPCLKPGAAIGVTAPSSGVSAGLHELVKQSVSRLNAKGYRVVCGDTVWTQHKAKSAPAYVRAAELNAMLQGANVDLIFPPWGGELLIEIVDKIDYARINDKWIMGYSDLSVLLLAVTLKTGLATAHSSNLIDARGEYADKTTAMWETVLATPPGGMVVQHSSEHYQKEWDHDNPSPCVFHLTEETSWKSVGERPVRMNGRLLGGCIDVIRHLIGTPYGDVRTFQREHIHGEPIIWYLENCELNTVDLRRSLVQMKLAGWMENCNGLMFGRSGANNPVQDYTALDVYEELAAELALPILYDIDCGHVPPQMTFINGARAEITAEGDKAIVRQWFAS